MRLVIAAALALCVAPSGFVQAQTVPVQPLAPGEVLLEIDATGEVDVPADRITLLAMIRTQGATPSEARRALDAVQARLVAAARGVGVREEDIDLNPPATQIGFIGNAAIDPEAVGWSVSGSKQAAVPMTSTLQVRVRDSSQVDRVRDALEGVEATIIQGPIFELSDDAEARRAAKSDALRRARAEAEAYARASGMRVVRMLRISERAPPDSARMTAMQDMMRLLAGRALGRSSEVQVRAVVGVDFALSPR